MFENILYLCGYLIFGFVLFQNLTLLYTLFSSQLNLQVGDKILYTHKYYQKEEIITQENEIIYYYTYYLFSCLINVAISLYMIINLFIV